MPYRLAEGGAEEEVGAKDEEAGAVGQQGQERAAVKSFRTPALEKRQPRDDSKASNTSEKSNGGRSNGGGRRPFSARGGGGAAGRGKSESGGRGSTSTSASLVQPVDAKLSIEQEVKAMTDQVS